MWRPLLNENISRTDAELHFMNSERHDNKMAFVQALPHLLLFLFAGTLKDSHISLKHCQAIDSPIYRTLYAALGRILLQDTDMHFEIMKNPNFPRVLDLIEKEVKHLRLLLDGNHRHIFHDQVMAWRTYFGDDMMVESDKLIEAFIVAIYTPKEHPR